MSCCCQALNHLLSLRLFHLFLRAAPVGRMVLCAPLVGLPPVQVLFLYPPRRGEKVGTGWEAPGGVEKGRWWLWGFLFELPACLQGLEGGPWRRKPLPALLFSVTQKYCFGFSRMSWKVLSVPIIQQMMIAYCVWMLQVTLVLGK